MNIVSKLKSKSRASEWGWSTSITRYATGWVDRDTTSAVRVEMKKSINSSGTQSMILNMTSHPYRLCAHHITWGSNSLAIATLTSMFGTSSAYIYAVVLFIYSHTDTHMQIEDEFSTKNKIWTWQKRFMKLYRLNHMATMHVNCQLVHICKKHISEFASLHLSPIMKKLHIIELRGTIN